MTSPVAIGLRLVGPGHPCFIIAEAGVNHNGDMILARRLIDEAAAAGADAVKFQTFTAEAVISPLAPKAAYQKVTTGAEQSQLDMVRQFELPLSAFRDLADHAAAKGIMFLSTPFDHASVDMLDDIGVPAFKVPSGEVTNLPLMRRIGATGKPVILSSGMSTLGEVETAIDILRGSGCPDIVLLHCTSAYPAAPASVNLRAMDTMAAAFGLPTGYSDHTQGIAVPIAAAARGAVCVEKHFTLDKALPGPDHTASLDPAELAAMITGIRTVELALGDGIKRPQADELDTRAVARRSLFAAKALPAGHRLIESDLIALRPSGGISPMEIDTVVGKTVARALGRGAMLGWDDLG